MAQLSETQLERASYIRAVLAWHDATQTGLAKVLGITQQSASQKLQGKRRFTDDELATIVDHYKLDPALVLKPARVADLLGVRESAPGLVRSTFKRFRRSEPMRHSYLRSFRPTCGVVPAFC